MLKTESVIFTYDGFFKFNFPDIQLNNGDSFSGDMKKRLFIQI